MIKLVRMFCCPDPAKLPEEYRAAAEALFPPASYPGEKVRELENVKAFAEILGICGEYIKRLESVKKSGSLGDLLVSFQNNLALLIQKTWVEKADESRKDDLLDRLPVFVGKIEKGEFPQALEEFGVILEELSYLFFGAESGKDDFTEYTVRIDAQMGLFWWYGGKLGCIEGLEWIKSADQDMLLALLLLGICYLADF
jgi:hypothetical protein